MQNENITRLSLEDIQKLPSQTDWKRVHTMTDEEITVNAQSDTDAPPLDGEFFEKMVALPES